SKRTEEEIEIDPKTGKPLDDEALRDISKEEYDKMKEEELKKKAQTSKLKQEERIEACEKLIKIYEKTYERPTIDFFFKTLEEIEGYEELKNIVGPPGTGKSAIVKLIAKASQRAYISIPMNGVDEPTYLKGREIAYGGADQGKLLKEMLNKGSSQPIVLIDELTRAKGKAVTDIIGTMTDLDQNEYSFEDD
ncbi:890_t:CDS:2, partial [Paraglomus occultum]